MLSMAWNSACLVPFLIHELLNLTLEWQWWSHRHSVTYWYRSCPGQRSCRCARIHILREFRLKKVLPLPGRVSAGVWIKQHGMPYYTQGFAHEVPVSFDPIDVPFHNFDAALKCLVVEVAMLKLLEQGNITGLEPKSLAVIQKYTTPLTENFATRRVVASPCRFSQGIKNDG